MGEWEFTGVWCSSGSMTAAEERWRTVGWGLSSAYLAGAEAATAATVLEAEASSESPASRMACDRLRSGVAVLVYALAAAVATAAAAGLASACSKSGVVT